MSVDATGRYFMGLETFVWWQGVVEDIDDPLQMGRMRVRILGWHPEDTDVLRREDLPWAFPVFPLNNGTPKPPPVGTWVVGWFRDGVAAQEPLVFGQLPVFPAGS